MAEVADSDLHSSAEPSAPDASPARASRICPPALGVLLPPGGVRARGRGVPSVNPVTEFVLMLNAVALPFTFVPKLIVANDPDYLGDKTNSRFTNALGTVYRRPRGCPRRER